MFGINIFLDLTIRGGAKSIVYVSSINFFKDKTMKLFQKSLITAALVLTASSSFAGKAGEFYMSADAGKTSVDGLTDAAGTYTCGTITATVTKDDSDTGKGLSGGYYLTDNFAVEFGYQDLGEASESLSLGTGTCNSLIGTITVTSAVTASAKWKADGYKLGGLYNIPVNDQLSIGLKGGLFKYDVDLTVSTTGGAGSLVSGGTTYTVSSGAGAINLNEDGSKAYFGLSADYAFTKNTSLGLSYQRFNSIGGDNVGGSGDVTYTSANIKYVF